LDPWTASSKVFHSAFGRRHGRVGIVQGATYTLPVIDYSFVPGFGDVALDLLRNMLRLRQHTAVVTDPTAVTVETFVGALDVAIDIGLEKADNFIIGSHGDEEGHLMIALDSANPAPAIYETLEQVDASGTIEVAAHMVTPNTGFHLAGCLIGSDECLPFLRKLKQALGSNVKTVTAPRYIHSLCTDPSATGIFEFMKYAHRVVSKEPFKTRDGVIGAFGAAGLKQDLDGTPVPLENFEKWVPAKALLNLAPATSHRLQFDFPVTISPAAGGFSTISKNVASWYATSDQVTFRAVLDPTDEVPTDEAGQLELVPLALANVDHFKDTHAFPTFKRYHFKTLQEFIDGFKWKPTVLPNKRIQFVGTRYRYQLHVPVFKPGTTDKLIFNYYPLTGTPTINFTESNQPFRLFGVV
jgi:hypothetical protein